MRITITGASSGIGLCLAKELSDHGHTITNIARRTCEFATSNILTDLSEKNISLDVINCLKQSDALILNSGLGQDQLLTLEQDEKVNNIIDLNLTKNILLVKYCTKAWISKRDGNIIMISSIAARTGLSGLSAYSASKAGLEAFARSAAKELGHYNIRINCIAPGFINTPMTANMPERRKEQIKRRIPLGRLGTEQDIVEAAEFLLKSNWITGQTIVVDGGFSV